MSAQADQVYKTQSDILAEVLAALLVRLPDANTGEDSLFRIWAEIFSGTTEGLYLGMQLLHDDMFIQTASALALVRFGEMYGRQQKAGTLATGQVTFAGTGATYIPLGTIVSAPRASSEDALDFQTTVDGTIPSPGTPTACVASDAGAGAVTAGTYEYAVTFVTAAGESLIGAVSNAQIIAASHSINLASVPVGGPGTIARHIYRRKNGGAWGHHTGLDSTFNNNTTTVAFDNDNTSYTGAPPTVSTAEAITVNASAVDTGTDSNVAAGAITDLSDAPSGLSTVTNASAFTGGTNPEDIEAFRTELLQYVRAPQSGSPNDLVVWAEAVDGVDTATVFPNVNLSGTATPGTVVVRISGPGGTIPDSTVQANVLAALQARDLANITILVGTFTSNSINVSVATTLATGYVLADVTPSVQAAVSAYINGLPVGATIYKAGVIDAVFGLPGIVNVTSTFTDTTQTATQKAVPGTITVT